jgi:glucose-1-phosphate thymidylyltransferase
MGEVIAVVLARGQGQRMRRLDPDARLTPEQAAAAHAGWKALMPIGGYPYLDYVLSALGDAGYRRAGLVIGPEHRDACRPYTEPGRAARVAVDLIEQQEPHGTADAVRSAERWVGQSPFVVLNGDNLYPVSVLRDLAALSGPGLAAFARDELVRSGNIPAARIESFALVKVDASSHLTQIVEKPSPHDAESAGPAALVSMNCWRFDDRIFEACADVDVSARGEYELPDAVALARARGMRVKVIRGHGTVLDLSSQSDVSEVSRRLIGVEPRP